MALDGFFCNRALMDHFIHLFLIHLVPKNLNQVIFENIYLHLSKNFFLTQGLQIQLNNNV